MDRKSLMSVRRVMGAVAVIAGVAISSSGCGSEGAGSIKIEPGARGRAEKPGGGDQSTKTLSKKQAAAQEKVEAAAKKNPKLY